jgi:hypothetical protein
VIHGCSEAKILDLVTTVILKLSYHKSKIEGMMLLWFD